MSKSNHPSIKWKWWHIVVAIAVIILASKVDPKDAVYLFHKIIDWWTNK